ncbi:MAG: NAD(P)(+) transhydrogenase (Re/Si-specific) subunit beta [Deltaproteobacteria bacterium]|nr:NAD(P)(+) transhydrogenase (Re/Si-specific) subunit beta [Deltaproteobacteria bacterium]
MIVAYLLAGVLFIRALGALSKQETARQGNVYAMIGMTVAGVITVVAWLLRHVSPSALSESLPESLSALPTASVVALGATVLVGSGIGVSLARRVEMTAMPELVAVLHSFVGLAAVLVGFASYLAPTAPTAGTEGERIVHLAEVWVGVAVGAITFTGSVVAWGKLKGTISGKPLLLPGRHLMNAILALLIIGLAGPFMLAEAPSAVLHLVLATTLAGLAGVHLVMAIGGADMPVVVSLLNSYSGWAAAAAGFMLANDLLIVTGALVGSSGTILSIIMCRAMNRSILNVVFGGFGTADSKPQSVVAPAGDVTEVKADEVAARLRDARSVIVVPGYGMAVSRAQLAVKELTALLRSRGVNVRFAIHPVAGRLPGHMNVLLAEAGVPYDIVHEMEHVNQDFAATDVVLVIGANDIVNPGALTDTSSSIYGMPVLEVWKARVTVVVKRGMAAGYAGVENPLFYIDNTRMLFGDAKKSLEAVIQALR